MIVRELFARLGIKTDAASFQRADGALNKVKQVAVGLASVLAARKVILGFKNIIIETTAAADAVAKTSAKLGIGIQALQEYQYAAQLSGVQVRTFNMGLQRFTRRTAEAAMGTGEAKDALLQMGIQLKDNQGRLRPADDLLLDVADSLSQVTDEGEKVRLAFKLFDSEGVSMINMLKGGSKALLDMRKRARDTGGVFSKEFADASEKTTDKLSDMERGLTEVKIAITEKLRPAFDWFIDKLRWGYLAIATIVKETNILEAALGVLGAALAVVGVKFIVAFAAPIAMGLALAAVVAIVILAVDEMITLFKGGETMIGRIAEAWRDWMEAFSNPANVKPGEHPIISFLRSLVDLIMQAQQALEDLLTAKEWKSPKFWAAVNTLKSLLPKAVGGTGEATTKALGFYGKAIEDFSEGQRRQYAGIREREAWAREGILPSSQVAGGGTSTSSSTVINAPVTVNASTLPGQSPEEYGEAAAVAVMGKLEEKMVNRAAAETLPLADQ